VTAAARAVFSRARLRVTEADVARYAPNDPGYLSYVAAWEEILRAGEPALNTSFDVMETIHLTRWRIASDYPDQTRFRWFRVLASAAEILIRPFNTGWNLPLAALLVDSFALAEAGDAAAPTDLLSGVCRELGTYVTRSPMDAREHGFCLLGELLLARVDGLGPAAIEALCAALDARNARYHRWWEHEGASWTDQPKSDEFLWSLTFFDQLHPVWLDLVTAHFPVEPAAAAAMKQRLLADGARWIDERRQLG
jgi:hypothetical protein